MTQELARARTDHLTAAEAARMTKCLPDFLRRRLLDGEVPKMIADLEELRREADSGWLAERIASLMAHYFVPGMDRRIGQAMAVDWMNELDGLPAWSIEAACIWWLGSTNPDIRRKPLPGEISKRARDAMGILRVGDTVLDRHAKGLPPMLNDKGQINV